MLTYQLDTQNKVLHIDVIWIDMEKSTIMDIKYKISINWMIKEKESQSKQLLKLKRNKKDENLMSNMYFH